MISLTIKNFYHNYSFVFCGFILLISVSDLKGQNIFERGKMLYEQRAAEADSFRADPTNINKAIEAFEQSLDQNLNVEQAASYLLRSYYFKGMFTGLPKDQQQQVYDKGRTLGKKMMKRFPDSVPIKFWYGANIGRWAEVHGFIEAATSGIAKKLRRVCEDIIEIDPRYEGGRGYRILAQVHFHAPHIPLVMSWPSDDKALELIEQAMDIAPEHPTNRMLYAQIMVEFDRNNEAKQHLQYILDMEPRNTHIVEDQYLKYRSRKLLEEHFQSPQ